MEMTIRQARIQYSGIPLATLETLYRFVEHRCPTGGFACAVLENNLMEAFGRADEGNRAAMFEICGFVYNVLPHNCHGSPEIVRTWLNPKTEQEKP